MSEMVLIDSFHASHAVMLEDGPEQPHGHNWTVRAEFQSLSYGYDIARTAISSALLPLADSHLNELPPFRNLTPSAEIVARYLHRTISENLDPAAVRLTKLSVQEEPGCWAAYLSKRGGN